MSIINQLPHILEEARGRNQHIPPGVFHLTEVWGPEENPAHRVFRGDNLSLMKSMSEDRETAGRVQMIYIDPPFFTRSDYDAVIEAGGYRMRHPAYRDTWTTGLSEYLTRLAQGLLLMRDMLTPDGLLWIHLDWHASHYARVLMDEIFGAENFVNEIIWEYKSGGSTRRRFARKHDNLMVYSKGKTYKFHPLKEKSYNRGLKPYRFKGVEEFCDEVGWYTMVNMKDVWQLDMVGRTSSERTGYATQKPEKLLARILQCCTDPGDLVADLFCGSGTLGAVAARQGRRSLQCDTQRLAVEISRARIQAEEGSVQVYDDGKREEAPPSFHASFQVNEKLGLREIVLVEVGGIRAPEGLDLKSAEKRARAVAEDPLVMITEWSVDPNYDGKVFRPVYVMRQGKEGLPLRCRLTAASGHTVIKVVDVMGRAEYFGV